MSSGGGGGSSGGGGGTKRKSTGEAKYKNGKKKAKHGYGNPHLTTLTSHPSTHDPPLTTLTSQVNPKVIATITHLDTS